MSVEQVTWSDIPSGNGACCQTWTWVKEGMFRGRKSRLFCQTWQLLGTAVISLPIHERLDVQTPHPPHHLFEVLTWRSPVPFVFHSRTSQFPPGFFCFSGSATEIRGNLLEFHRQRLLTPNSFEGNRNVFILCWEALFIFCC